MFCTYCPVMQEHHVQFSEVQVMRTRREAGVLTNCDHLATVTEYFRVFFITRQTVFYPFSYTVLKLLVLLE